MAQKNKKSVMLDFRLDMRHFEDEYISKTYNIYEIIWDIVNNNKKIDVKIFDNIFTELDKKFKKIIGNFTKALRDNFSTEPDMLAMASFYDNSLAQSPALALMEDVHKIENWQGLSGIPKENIMKMFKKATAQKEQVDDGSIELNGIKYDFLDMVFFQDTEYIAVKNGGDIKITYCVPAKKGNEQLYTELSDEEKVAAVKKILTEHGTL